MSLKPVTKLLAIGASLLLLAGCAAEPGSNAAPAPDAKPDAAAETTPKPQDDKDADESKGNDAESSDSGYAFGVNRDQLASAIETAFSSQNGKARWEGDTLILKVDGDAEGTMAGYTQCSTLSHLVNEDDLTKIEFPNGTIDCAEALAD